MKLTFEAPCIRRGVMVFSFIIAFGGLKFVDDLNMEIEMSSLDIPCFALFKLEAATFSVFPPAVENPDFIVVVFIAFGGLKFVDDLNMEIEMSSLDIPCFALFKLEAATFSVFPPAVENPDFIVFVFSFIVFEVKPLFVFSFSNFGVSTMFDVDVLDTLKFSVVLFT